MKWETSKMGDESAAGSGLPDISESCWEFMPVITG